MPPDTLFSGLRLLLQGHDIIFPDGYGGAEELTLSIQNIVYP
jgi:hypothetical protein